MCFCLLPLIVKVPTFYQYQGIAQDGRHNISQCPLLQYILIPQLVLISLGFWTLYSLVHPLMDIFQLVNIIL